MDRHFFKIKLSVKLLRGYLQAHWKLFLSGLILGIVLFWLAPVFYSRLVKVNRTTSIGLVGNYTISNLPIFLQEKISFGLTTIDDQGQATSGAALSYTASESAKSVTFYIDKSLHWQDGEPLKVDDINYNLRGVQTIKTADTITYILPEPYSPLPTVLSQPLFKNGYYSKISFLPDFINTSFFKTSLIGLGENKINSIKFNARFVSQLDLVNISSQELVSYKFYPSLEQAINALKLGQVTQVDGIYTRVNLSDEKHFEVKENIQPDYEAILFYNLDDELLASKEFRQALTYAIPDNFNQGVSADTPFPQNSWARNANIKHYPFNVSLAQSQIKKLATSSASPKTEIRIATNIQLLETANEIAESWRNAGLNVSVENTDIIPPHFQTYLAIVPLPKDPDQYFLWHSTQRTNISNYKSPKVDRLLEEARQTFDLKTREIKYSDFQKAITEDAPAAFLFYPKVYSVLRRY